VLARRRCRSFYTQYGLITAVIAVALIAPLIIFRQQISGMFTRAGNAVDNAGSSP
jgi:Flp pilus assembly pilin Flp